jgi:hypothetical protein
MGDPSDLKGSVWLCSLPYFGYDPGTGCSIPEEELPVTTAFKSFWRLRKLTSEVRTIGGGLPLSKLLSEDGVSLHTSASFMGTVLSGAKKFFVTTDRGFW